MYRLNQVKLNIYHSDTDFKNKIAKVARVSVDEIDWSTLIILHKAIDARDKNNILFVYNVAFDFVGENANNVGVNACRAIEKYEPIVFNPIIRGSHSSPIQKGSHSSQVRPVVVGFGPAGIFASYIFALNGLKPIILERGKALEDRIKDVDRFFETMELDEESNVCFGEGGAGAFSDGKLNTNNKDKTGIYHFILETFVKFGADERILYESMPHIGTDKLVDVIKKIRDEILLLGGEIHYNTKFTFKDRQTALAPTVAKDTPVVLAIGNSSRDIFRELIENGFSLKPKPFAIGYRIAHRQSMIDDVQYGEGSHSSPVQEGSRGLDRYEKLGPATYKLTYDVGNGHSVYSFCMCPGGYIINSSNYKGMLSINGMSYNDRGGKYANSAIVETVSPEDILGSHSSTIREGSSERGDAEKMIEFQEMIERRAFELEKGFIPYVANAGSDICPEEVFKGRAKYCDKLKTVFDDLGLEFNINDDIEKALRHFNRIIPGFFDEGSHSSPVREGSHSSPIQVGSPHYIIAGVETRTSSPVKLDRDENYMCNVPNYYPCGEGLGHGGGIISCAADGVKVALKICENLLK